MVTTLPEFELVKFVLPVTRFALLALVNVPMMTCEAPFVLPLVLPKRNGPMAAFVRLPVVGVSDNGHVIPKVLTIPRAACWKNTAPEGIHETYGGPALAQVGKLFAPVLKISVPAAFPVALKACAVTMP
jgi:hypothetical protein